MDNKFVDYFGNSVDIGDHVLYFHTQHSSIRFVPMTVTRFTKTKMGGVTGKIDNGKRFVLYHETLFTNCIQIPKHADTTMYEIHTPHYNSIFVPKEIATRITNMGPKQFKLLAEKHGWPGVPYEAF